MKKKFFAQLLLFLSFTLSAQIYEDEIKKIQPKEYSLTCVKPIKLQNSLINYFLGLFTTTDWNYTYKRENIISPIVAFDKNQFQIDSFIYCNKTFDELEVSIKKDNTIKSTAFFKNYLKSNFYNQLNSYKLNNALVFIFDIDDDNNEEILYFGQVEVNSPKGLLIKKYIDKEWKLVFSQIYFGFYDWNESFFLEGKSNNNSLNDDWFSPKIFPYDFIEYKGKIGLRIICYDQPKDWPSHYHAQFWVYDENIKQYEMLEEVWNTEEDTPPDGLVFVEAKTDLFTKKELSYSKLDKKLTDEDIKYLTKNQLRIMRNAIYARHGRTFKSVDLQTLWESYTWYKKNPNYSDDLLTDIDKYNIQIIQKYESK